MKEHIVLGEFHQQIDLIYAVRNKLNYMVLNSFCSVVSTTSTIAPFMKKFIMTLENVIFSS